MSEKNKIFISYRRDSVGNAFAGRIFDALKHYGYDVYLDVENLAAGKWKNQLLNEVEKRNHFIIVLTPNSLSTCNNTTDMVRLEYEKAIATNSNIVPVLEETQSFRNLKSTSDASMKDLFDLNGIKLRHNSFQSDIGKLINDFIPPMFTSKETFANITITLLILLSSIITYYFGSRESNWSYAPLILISVCLLMFRNIFTLPKELKRIVYFSLSIILLGTLILYDRIMSNQLIGDPMAIVGISALAFGIGLGTFIPIYRKIKIL